jgi:hypothetical protein
MIKAAKKLKPRKCRQCGGQYTPANGLQRVCSPGCALADARRRRQAEAEKAAKAETRATRERLKSRAKLRAEAQTAFNQYIRNRDAARGCISCGTMTAGQYHAGHYRTRKAAPQISVGTWLSCLNVNKQCAQCNLYDSGNIAGQRRGLVERYGEATVQRLERSSETASRDAEWYRRCRDIYRRRARHIVRLRARIAARETASEAF